MATPGVLIAVMRSMTRDGGSHNKGPGPFGGPGPFLLAAGRL